MENIQEIFDSQNSKINFIRGMILLAKADGEAVESEINYYMYAAQGIGIDEANLTKIKDAIDHNIDSKEIIFENKKQSLIFIQEALQLSYIDNRYDKNERKIIHAIAKINKISVGAVKQIEDWVLDGMLWKKAGEELLNRLEV